MDFNWLNYLAMKITQMSPLDEEQSRHIGALIENFNMRLGPLGGMLVRTQFSELRDLDEKFAFIWNLPEAYQFLILPLSRTTNPRKAEDEAERLKMEGNTLFKQKKLDAALKYYTLAISRAPHPELSICPISPSSSGKENKQVNLSSNDSSMTKYKTLAFSYANRAAVLLEMKKYDKCLRDIELALKHGYPKLLKKKLLKRKERCLSAQRQKNASEESVERELPVLSEPNKTIPSLSSAVRLAYSEGKGRHVVAAKAIQPGEVIAVEETPFIFIHPDRHVECCLVCSRISDAPLPCPTCWMGFCSETCRTIGLRNFHRKECKVFSALVELGFDVKAYVVIAMKLLLRTPFEEIKEKLNVLQWEAKELSPEKLGFDSEGIYSSTDYRTMFHMPSCRTNSSEHHKFTLCLMAVVLTKLLCEAEGVAINTLNLPESIFHDIVTKGAVIYQLLLNQPLQMELNTLKVATSLDDVYSQSLGKGIFPAAALINHSCCASAMIYNIGPVLIVRAIRSIPSGSEVTVSYSGFEKTPKIERIMRLQYINRNCFCEACVKDWPLIDEFPYAEFLCIKCSEPLKENKCNKCEIDYGKPDYEGEKRDAVEQWLFRVYQFKQAEERYQKIAQRILMNQPVTKADFDDVCKFVVMLENNVKFPSQIFYFVHFVLAEYFEKY